MSNRVISMLMSSGGSMPFDPLNLNPLYWFDSTFGVSNGSPQTSWTDKVDNYQADYISKPSDSPNIDSITNVVNFKDYCFNNNSAQLDLSPIPVGINITGLENVEMYTSFNYNGNNLTSLAYMQGYFIGTGNVFDIRMGPDNRIYGGVRGSGQSFTELSSSIITSGNYIANVRFSSGVVELWVNGVMVDTDNAGAITIDSSNIFNLFRNFQDTDFEGDTISVRHNISFDRILTNEERTNLENYFNNTF